MSAFISLTGGDSCILFTDGAAYDDDGVLRAISRKVSCAKREAFAVTSLGNALLGDHVKAFLCEQADKFGVDRLFEEVLPQFLDEMKSEWSELATGKGAIDVHIVAYSKARGAFHAGFQTIAESHRQDIAPFKLKELGAHVMRGPVFDVMDMAQLRQPIPGETRDHYARYYGVAIMDLMRKTIGLPHHVKGSGRDPYCCIGGHVDMTVLNAKGVHVNRIHVWDDRTGEKVRPDLNRGTVQHLDGMSRQQRRALERQAKRRVA